MTTSSDSSTPVPDFVDPTGNPDAMAWADAFCGLVEGGKDATDRGWLVSWFANAMAEGERRSRGPHISPEAGVDLYDEHHELGSRIFQSLGTASVCWESMSGTGTFKDDLARQVGNTLLAWIVENYEPKSASTSTD